MIDLWVNDEHVEDWGKVEKEGYHTIKKIAIIENTHEIEFFTDFGVIYIDGVKKIVLGVNLGGYLYTLENDCMYEITQIAPFVTAIANPKTNESKDLEKHLSITAKIMAIRDKVSKEYVDIETPVFKTFLISLDKDANIIIA